MKVSHNAGKGYQSAGEFLIGGVIKDGRKRFVAYNAEKDECYEESADTSGFRKILGWVFAIAAGLLGLKILAVVLGIIVRIIVVVIFAVIAKALWDSN